MKTKYYIRNITTNAPILNRFTDLKKAKSWLIKYLNEHPEDQYCYVIDEEYSNREFRYEIHKKI